MSEFTQQFCEAMGMIANNAISQAAFDRTIQGTIISCVDASLNEYKIKYQDSTFYAYAATDDAVYSEGLRVYILVPENNMSNKKTILGSVKALGKNYSYEASLNETFNPIGNNIVNMSPYIEIGLTSYDSNIDKATEEQKIHGIEQVNEIFLYNVENEHIDSNISIDFVGLNQYIKGATYLKCGANFRTNLPASQQIKGNYGIEFKLRFKDSMGEDIIKIFTIDIDSMNGNPYNFIQNTEQYIYYEIDGQNFIRLESIRIFTKNFPVNRYELPIEQQILDLRDIFVSDIQIISETKISAEELNGNLLTLTTPQGAYFDYNIQNDKTIVAQFRSKGRTISDKDVNLKYYWFIEQANVNTEHDDYCVYGGTGWKCLNTQKYVPAENNTQETVKYWAPATNLITVRKEDLLVQERKFKCVAIYNGLSISKTVLIKNYNSQYFIKLTTDAGTTAFTPSAESPVITCSVFQRSIKNGKVQKDSEGNDILIEQNAENFIYNWIQVDKYNRTTTLLPIDNIAANKRIVDLSSFEDNLDIKCAVVRKQDGENFGTHVLTLVNKKMSSNGFSLSIINGSKVIKYNESGISPTLDINLKPLVLQALAFQITDLATGAIIRSSDKNFPIPEGNILWTIPQENSLIKPITNNNKEFYTSTSKVLSYEIKDRYDPAATNNTINLTVNYQGQILTAFTEFSFVKEGDIGTNGTEFFCRIVPLPYDRANRTGLKKADLKCGYISATTTDWENFTLDSGCEEGYWLKAELFKNEDIIYAGHSSVDSFTVQWKILNKSGQKEENTFLSCTENGYFYANITKETDVANFIKVTITYEKHKYYAIYPIVSVKHLEGYSAYYEKGFNKVLYDSAGYNPIYDDMSGPFITYLYDKNNVIINNTAHAWWTTGKSSDDVQHLNILEDNNNNNNSRLIKPVDFYDGIAVNNAVCDSIFIEDRLIAIINIPIYMYLNYFEIPTLNDWDGTTVDVNQEKGYIMTPQVGAGEKDAENKFTGVLIGSSVLNNQKETGLMAFSHGERSAFIDAETGKAVFGVASEDGGQIVIDPNIKDKKTKKSVAQIKSNTYVYKKAKDQVVPVYNEDNTIKDYETIRDPEAGNGLLIDFSTPYIKYGSGRFEVNEFGEMLCTGADIDGELHAKTANGDFYLGHKDMYLKFHDIKKETNLTLKPNLFSFESKNLGSLSMKPDEIGIFTPDRSSYLRCSINEDPQTGIPKARLRFNGDFEIKSNNGEISLTDKTLELHFINYLDPVAKTNKISSFKITPTQLDFSGFYHKEIDEDTGEEIEIYDNNPYSYLKYDNKRGVFTLQGELHARNKNGFIDFSEKTMRFLFTQPKVTFLRKSEDTGELEEIEGFTSFKIEPLGFKFGGYDNNSNPISQLLFDSRTGMMRLNGEVYFKTENGSFTLTDDNLLLNFYKIPKHTEGNMVNLGTEMKISPNTLIFRSYMPLENPNEPDDEIQLLEYSASKKPNSEDEVVISNQIVPYKVNNLINYTDSYGNSSRGKRKSSLEYNSATGKFQLFGDLKVSNKNGSIYFTEDMMSLDFIPGYYNAMDADNIPQQGYYPKGRVNFTPTQFLIHSYRQLTPDEQALQQQNQFFGETFKSEDGTLYTLRSGLTYFNGNLSITGRIVASSGNIGGWEVKDTAITSATGKMKLNADGTITGLGSGVNSSGIYSPGGVLSSESLDEKIELKDGVISFFQATAVEEKEKDNKKLVVDEKTGKSSLKVVKEKYNQTKWVREAQIYTHDKYNGGLTLSSQKDRPLIFAVGGSILARFEPKVTNEEKTIQARLTFPYAAKVDYDAENAEDPITIQVTELQEKIAELEKQRAEYEAKLNENLSAKDQAAITQSIIDINQEIEQYKNEISNLTKKVSDGTQLYTHSIKTEDYFFDNNDLLKPQENTAILKYQDEKDSTLKPQNVLYDNTTNLANILYKQLAHAQEIEWIDISDNVSEIHETWVLPQLTKDGNFKLKNGEILMREVKEIYKINITNRGASDETVESIEFPNGTKTILKGF